MLAHIDPDRYIDKKNNCNNYTIKEFNGNFSGLQKFSIFHTNIRSSKQNLLQLKNFLGTLNNDFSIIGLMHLMHFSAFNDELDKMLGIIQEEKKYAYILGDFNVNTLDELTGRSLDCQTFINLFSAHYHRKLIDVPTRVVENSFTLLDNVYTNCPITESSGVLKTDITDHYSIFTVRDHLEPIKDSKHREVRNLSIKIYI